MGQVGSHAPFPLVPVYMDGPDLAFRVIQEFHKARDVFLPRWDAKFTKTFDILHRFVVVHDSPPVPLRQGPRQKARAGFPARTQIEVTGVFEVPSVGLQGR